MGGGGGKWMETEVRLSTGAFEAMWREHGLRPDPVLQLADDPRMAGGLAAKAGPYRFALSDGGERLQPGVLAASLNHLVVRGVLRRGTVIRVLEYFAGFFHNQSAIIVIQLDILHAECMLIRSPTTFEANATQHIDVSCSGGPAIHEPCFMPCTQQVLSNSSCSPDKRVLDSSVTPKAEPTVINLPFSECFRSMPTQSTVDAKMQQLSLKDHQNLRFTVTATGLSGAMAAQLTPGAVVAISEHPDGNMTLPPMVQVVDVRMVTVKNPSNGECYRMVLSDGVHTMLSMLSTFLNSLLWDGSIKNGSIIHLQEFTCSSVHNHRIIIVTKLYVLQSECNIMGNPKPYEMRNQPNEQVTNLLPNAAQANTGTYSSGPGMLGSSAAPRRVQDVNNVPYGGSYHDYKGMMGASIHHAVESVPIVASGLPYGTTSAHNNTTNMGIVQSNLQLQQPSLNSHQNPRFAVPSMAGDGGAPGNTYDKPAQSFYQQPPPGHICRTPVSKNDESRLLPVAQLNPYQERWTIKVRVTSKTDLTHYNNVKGHGKVFSFDLLDGQGGEIRARCFNAQADQFFDLIEVDKVYLISRGSLKPALKKLNSLNHAYEIILDIKTSIEVCAEDDSNIPRLQYNFRQISEIENIEPNALVDLIGIVTSVGPSATIIRKVGSEAKKRTLQLKDMSGRSVEITLWGKFCDAEGQQLQLQCDSGLNPVLALKGARISDFNGRSVSSIGSTQIKIDPELPEAEGLRRWYATEGKTAAFVSLSVVSMGRTDVQKVVAQIKEEDLGRSDKPDFITVKGAISHVIADNFCYPACTMEVNGRLCNKKLINNGDGTWWCGKCDMSLPNCEYRYLLQCRIQDHTGVTYATAFQAAGMEIVGHSADELYNIREEDPERFAEILQGVHWQQFLFMLKVKKETFNDEQRVVCSIMRAEKLDHPARQSMLTSSNINLQLERASYRCRMLTSNNVGATGFAQSNWMPTPPSASSGGFDFNGGFGFLGQSAASGAPLCFKCNQPGHWSKDCLI